MPIHNFFTHYNNGVVKTYSLVKDDDMINPLTRMLFSVYHKNTISIIKISGKDPDQLLDQAAGLIDLIIST